LTYGEGLGKTKIAKDVGKLGDVFDDWQAAGHTSPVKPEQHQAGFDRNQPELEQD